MTETIQLISSHRFHVNRFQTTKPGPPATNLPFGDWLTWPSTNQSPVDFTGQRRDPESGLDDFTARSFGSSLGRFMSPDEPFLDQEAGDPQSWNLYSYVRNNPLRFTDADGRACVSLNGKPFHNDNSGGQSCEVAAEPQQITVGLTDDDRIRMTFSLTYDMATDRNYYLKSAQDATLAYGLGKAAWELPGLVRAGWSLITNTKFDHALVDASSRAPSARQVLK